MAIQGLISHSKQREYFCCLQIIIHHDTNAILINYNIDILYLLCCQFQEGVNTRLYSSLVT